MQVLSNTDPAAINKLFARQAGGIVFDIGANAGQSVERLLPRFERVVAVEPDTDSFNELTSRYEDDDRVIRVHAACSDHTGTVTLEVRDKSIESGQLTTGAPGLHPWGDRIGVRDVPAVTCDQLMREYGIPDLLKIDVEGHESLVLEGADRTLKTKPYVLIEIHSRQNGRDCLRILKEHDYQHLEVRRHNAYVEDSWGWNNHYWLVGQ